MPAYMEVDTTLQKYGEQLKKNVNVQGSFTVQFPVIILPAENGSSHDRQGFSPN